MSRSFVVRTSSLDERAVDMPEERGRLETFTQRTGGWLDEDANVWFRVPMRPDRHSYGQMPKPSSGRRRFAVRSLTDGVRQLFRESQAVVDVTSGSTRVKQ